MSDALSPLPLRLQEIVEEFNLCQGKEKLELLLEFSKKLPPLPDWLAQNQRKMEPIHECMTPILVYAEMENGGLEFYFDAPPESPSVRGYAALLGEGVRGSTPEQILAIPGDFYSAMGLQEVLSPQRLHGLRAILAHIKKLAQRHKRNS